MPADVGYPPGTKKGMMSSHNPKVGHKYAGLRKMGEGMGYEKGMGPSGAKAKGLQNT